VAIRVGELARRTGVGVSTLRAWERRFGILDPVRSPSGQRLYAEDDVERVAAVCRLVAEGLTLSAAVGRIAAGGSGGMPTGEGEAYLLHQLVQAADQGIWVSQDGHTRYANRRMAELMGCSIDDLLARPVLEFLEPESLETVRSAGLLVREGHRQHLEVRMRRADGSSFLAEVSTTPLRDASGGYNGAVAVVSDVTARRQADAEASFRIALLDAIGDAVVAARPDGTIVYANPAVERVLGWRVADLIGQNGLELLPTPDATSSSTRIHSTLLAKRRHSGELELSRRDGTRFVAHVTGSPVLDARGGLSALIAVLSDNTERDRLEHEARSKDQQAETVALLGARALRCDSSDRKLVLTEAVEATRRVLQSEHSALLEIVAGNDELRVRVASPQVDEPTVMPSGSRSLCGYTVLAGKVVVVEDVRRDRRFDTPPGPGPAQLGIVSAIAAPVFGPSGVSGVLIAATTELRRFDSSAAHFVQSMANVVGSALEHA
jgi:PAS domain S-box-containing protein